MVGMKKFYSLLTLGLLGLFLSPTPLIAQGGDAVYRSLRVQIPIERQYLEPQGLQDAGYDLLTSDMNIMSSTYVTVLSASVTVGETGDAVLVHVTGQFGLLFPLYITDDAGSAERLWRQDDPTNPGGAVLVGLFPSGLDTPVGMTSHGGALFIVDLGGNQLWRQDDPTNPPGAVLVGAFPSGLSAPSGITSHGGALFIVNRGPGVQRGELWRLDDPTNPGGAVEVGEFPAGLGRSTGITSHGGALFIVEYQFPYFNNLWRQDDPTNPGGAVEVGPFQTGINALEGITSHGGELCAVDSFFDTLWCLDDPTYPGGAVLAGFLPGSVNDPKGLAGIRPVGPCVIRLARGTTEIEEVSFGLGRILFDTTFSDAPPVGTHVYNLQVKSEQQGGCTAYRGDGSVPMPSMLVQSYYAGSIP